MARGLRDTRPAPSGWTTRAYWPALRELKRADMVGAGVVTVKVRGFVLPLAALPQAPK